MSETSRKVARLRSGAPIGNMTPTSGRLAKDAAGRVYVYKTLEQHNAGRKASQYERDKRHFSFGHMRNIREITRGLSNKYCGYILLLQPHIQFKTNVLVAEGREGKPLTLVDLAKVWDVSKRTARAIVDELEARSIIFETDGRFTLNDRYHFRGKAVGDVGALIKTFFTTLKGVRMTAADLGFVYKLLPYVHFDTNVICADPFASNPEDVRFLNEKQISEIVEMNADKARESLTRLRRAGVVGEWFSSDDSREKLTVLNPYVFYRKNGEPDGTLRTLFAAKRFGA